jgi:hypothetical protein
LLLITLSNSAIEAKFIFILNVTIHMKEATIYIVPTILVGFRSSPEALRHMGPL